MQTSPEVTDSYFEVMLWMMALLVVALVGLFHRRRHIQFCLAAFVGFIMFLAMGFIGIALQSAPTSFAADHPIPAGLAYDIPLGEREDMAAAVSAQDTTTFLQVRNGHEGGIYEYSFFYPSLPEGIIWLQCYEVTQNRPLSKKKHQEEIKAGSGWHEPFFTTCEGQGVHHLRRRLGRLLCGKDRGLVQRQAGPQAQALGEGLWRPGLDALREKRRRQTRVSLSPSSL